MFWPPIVIGGVSGPALTSNFDEADKGAEPFSVTAAIRYLEGLNAKDPAAFRRAWDYIKKAPAEVETPVRDAVAKHWPQAT